MPQSLTEMAKDLVEEMVKNKLLAPEDMQQKLREFHASLLELKTREDSAEAGTGGAGDNGTLHTKDRKKSIRKNTVECLVCGQIFKQFSARHLRHHDLDPRTYRERFGIPANQPLSARAITAMRKRVVQETDSVPQLP